LIDLKYHIASMVAIFCALAIGIFIGSNLVGNDVLLEQQKEVVASLEQEFNTLREQNRIVQEELMLLKDKYEDYRSYCEQVFPLVVDGKLAGMSVAVIETNSQGLAEKVEQALRTAGAEVMYVAIMDWKIEPDWNTLLAQRDDGGVKVREKDIRPAAARKLGEMLVAGEDKDMAEELIACGFLDVKGKLGQPVDGIIIIEGSDEDRTPIAQSFYLPLTEYFLKKGIKVVVGEYESALFSYIEQYKLKPVTTVDNIDSPIGLTSAIFSLSGRTGNYGVRHTAERLIPEIDND